LNNAVGGFSVGPDPARHGGPLAASNEKAEYLSRKMSEMGYEQITAHPKALGDVFL